MSKPTPESFPINMGPTDRARHDMDADTPLIRARNCGDGVVFAILKQTDMSQSHDARGADGFEQLTE